MLGRLRRPSRWRTAARSDGEARSSRRRPADRWPRGDGEAESPRQRAVVEADVLRCLAMARAQRSSCSSETRSPPSSAPPPSRQAAYRTPRRLPRPSIVQGVQCNSCNRTDTEGQLATRLTLHGNRRMPLPRLQATGLEPAPGEVSARMVIHLGAWPSISSGEAQVDFFEVTVELDGERRKA